MISFALRCLALLALLCCALLCFASIRLSGHIGIAATQRSQLMCDAMQQHGTPRPLCVTRKGITSCLAHANCKVTQKTIIKPILPCADDASHLAPRPRRRDGFRVVPMEGEGTRHRERQMEGGGLQNVSFHPRQKGLESVVLCSPQQSLAILRTCLGVCTVYHKQF